MKGGGYEEVTVDDDPDIIYNSMRDKILDYETNIKATGCNVCTCNLAPMDIGKWNQHRLQSKKTK